MGDSVSRPATAAEVAVAAAARAAKNGRGVAGRGVRPPHRRPPCGRWRPGSPARPGRCWRRTRPGPGGRRARWSAGPGWSTGSGWTRARLAGMASSSRRWPRSRPSRPGDGAGAARRSGAAGVAPPGRRDRGQLRGAAERRRRRGVAADRSRATPACLRTGSAALRSAEALLDHVVGPALAEVGLDPAAIQLVRLAGSRGRRRRWCAQPGLIPLVILRGSGESTRQLAEQAALCGVRTLGPRGRWRRALPGPRRRPGLAADIIARSLDRLGVCNRLNLLLVA